jgi:hypothetical protein
MRERGRNRERESETQRASSFYHDIYNPWNGSSPDTKSADNLILDLLAYRSMINKFLSFLNRPICNILL